MIVHACTFVHAFISVTFYTGTSPYWYIIDLRQIFFLALLINFHKAIG